jgi:hypothetical protein
MVSLHLGLEKVQIAGYLHLISFTVLSSYPFSLTAEMDLNDNSAFAAFDAYRRFESPFIVRLQEAFTTHQLGGADLVVVYENHPGAVKLEGCSHSLRGDTYAQHVFLWIGQLLWMLHSVHQAGLCLDKLLCMNNLLLSVALDRCANLTSPKA